jgi:KaiC/GvpD/RAD55 family RecA-like ATPase
MAHLHKLLEETVGGRGRIAMVTGAVATGKSELLHGFADQALEQGALPLSATGSRAERALLAARTEHADRRAPQGHAGPVA